MNRKDNRFTFLQEVELEFASGKRSARISDISAGGCYIDTIAQVPVGESLKLNIGTTSGETMQFNARVAYVLENFGFGVEFTELDDSQRAFLDRLVASVTS